MPTGALAKVGSSIPVQNARMLQMLTAKYGGVMVYHDDLEKRPLLSDDEVPADHVRHAAVLILGEDSRQRPVAEPSYGCRHVSTGTISRRQRGPLYQG
jgi:hypothetical protein